MKNLVSSPSIRPSLFDFHRDKFSKKDISSIDIHLHALGKEFAGQWVFRNLNYTFQSGQSYLVLGPNGSGKSTLLSLLVGFNRPSIGSIRYLSKGYRCRPRYVHFGWTGPYIDIPESLTLEELLCLSTRLSPKEKACSYILSSMGLSKFRTQLFSRLSSGMRQRALLGITFGKAPRVVLLDEPLHHLDETYKDYCTQGIKSCKEAGSLVIAFSSSSADQVLCDHALHLRSIDQSSQVSS